MHKRTILGALAFASLGLSATKADESANGSRDEQVIRESVDDYCAAFNKGDLDALLAYWAHDADYVDEDGETFRGKDAIGALFKNSAEELEGCKLGLEIEQLRLVKPDVAIEDGIAELTDAEGDTDRGHYTAVWVKTDGQWLISSARELPSDDDSVSTASTDSLKPLDWLVGKWVSEDDGPTVHLECRWALDKNFLVQDYTVAGKDGDDLRVTQWIGFDPSTAQIRSWTFDSRGGYGDGLWTREDNTWRSETTGVLPDGRIGTSFNTIRFVDDTHLEWRSTGRNVEGQPMPDAEVRLVRSDKSELADEP
jgi:uncharacterized protein (TIGR02246 family)